MAKFSERYGHVPVRSVLQVDDIDPSLRNRLWNITRTAFFYDAPTFKGAAMDILSSHNRPHDLFADIWHNFFKEPVDTVGISYFNALNNVRKHFMECHWYEVYDFLEFLSDPPPNNTFFNMINEVLKEEMSGYRFVSGRIAKITSEQEIAAIEEALSVPDSLKPVREHLNQSLALLSDRKVPDYRNSIKESISAVESLSKIILKQAKGTLGLVLNEVEKKVKLHAVLKEAFQKLYGYTSDAQGIRHALMDEPTLDFEDAKFMLVSCSAFVNYLVVKAQKAGITI
jgi:AbiJ N-terminal domain 4